MGNAKSVPVLGETAALTEYKYKMDAAQDYEAKGDYEAARRLRESAKDAWTDYCERNLIVGSVNVIYRLVTLNPGEASRVGGKMTSSLDKFTDCVPILGHVKGAFYNAMGNTEKGRDCLNKSTRSATVAGSALVNTLKRGAFMAGAVIVARSGIPIEALPIRRCEELFTRDDVATGSSAGYAYDSKRSAELGRDVGSVRALSEAKKTQDPLKLVNVQLGQLGDSWGAPGTDVFYDDE